MRIEMRPVGEVHPYPDNPRVNDDAVDAVAASIRAFGFRNPITIDADGVVVTGHTRLRAALRLGLAEVPVVVLGDLPPEKIRAYRIADNQTGNLSTWDDRLLPIELAALREAGFDLSLVGFPEGELDRMLEPPEAEGGGDGADGGTDEDDIPAPPVEPKSVAGGLYQLGRHRLLCGDSTRADVIARLMGAPIGNAKADLFLTDPPYGVAVEGATEDRLTIENDDLAPDAFLPFLASAFRAADAALRPGAALYIWHADRHGELFHDACREMGWGIRRDLVWIKSNMVLGRQDYQWKHELCLYGVKPGAEGQPGAGRVWLADRPQSSVLRFDKPARNADHPTMKPVELFACQLAHSCPEGGLILDSFGGSGTTAIAAEKTGRRAALAELDPKYCDVIRRRWAEFVHGAGCDWETLTPPVASHDVNAGGPESC